VGKDFRVGLAREPVSLFHELGFALREILENAVVHDDDVAGAIAMRVRVGFGRPAVRGPAGVSDSRFPDRARGPELLHQAAELARRAVDLEAAVRQRRDARGVVPPVFEPLQALQEQGRGLLGADVSDDAAHQSTFAGMGNREPAVENVMRSP